VRGNLDAQNEGRGIVKIYLLLLVVVIPTSIAAWIVRLRMRRRVKAALGRTPASEVELTSLRTWMRVETEEERNRVSSTPEGAASRQDTALLASVDASAAQGMNLPARQGRQLVLPFGAALPPFCLKCGKPAPVYKELTLTWFPEAGNTLYLLVGVMTLRNVTVSLPLCSAHLWRRGALKLCGVLLVIAAIPAGMFVGDDLGSGIVVGFLTVILTFIAGVLMWWRSEVLHIRQLNDDEIVFTGAGEEFLNILPLRDYFDSTVAGGNADQYR
jgi:hypothetical protein